MATKNPKVILYSTSLHAWEVWQTSRPMVKGSLENCQAAAPDALPVSQHQLDLARNDLGNVRWAACSATEFGPVGTERHLVQRGALDTYCGHSANRPSIWRGNTTKPKCANCKRIAQKEGLDV